MADNKHGVLLTDEEYAAICGLVAPEAQVNKDGIMMAEHHWDSLRSKFPVQHFYKQVGFDPTSPLGYEADEDADINYEPNAGW
jgi:hypothetical protein